MRISKFFQFAIKTLIMSLITIGSYSLVIILPTWLLYQDHPFLWTIWTVIGTVILIIFKTYIEGIIKDYNNKHEGEENNAKRVF